MQMDSVCMYVYSYSLYIYMGRFLTLQDLKYIVSKNYVWVAIGIFQQIKSNKLLLKIPRQNTPY